MSFSVSMPAVRYGMASVLLRSIKVLIAAADYTDDYTNTALVYTP